MLAGVMKIEQVPFRQSFLRRPGRGLAGHGQVLRAGAEARGPARDVHAGHLRASAIRRLAQAFGIAEAEAEVNLDAIATLIQPRDPILARSAAPAPASTRQYLMCGALQLLSFFVYAWAVALVGARAYEWISAAQGYAQIYLRSVVFGGAAFIVLCTLPILAKWVLIGRWKPQQIRIWSLGYFRFWLVKTLIKSNPLALGGRRLAAVHVVPAGAGRQDRAGDGDLHPARAGLHRPAHHRPGHGDPQGVVPQLLPGLRGLDPDRPGHHRPERVHRREDRARHQHLDGRRVAARPHLRTAQRPAGPDRRALARVPGPAYRPELPAGLGQALRPVAPVQVQRRHLDLRVLPVPAAARRGPRSPC
jgi:hypothetical protein